MEDREEGHLWMCLDSYVDKKEANLIFDFPSAPHPV